LRIPYGKGIELYTNGPPLVQKTLGFLFTPLSRSTMLGSNFHFFLAELRRTQWYGSRKLKEYQEKRLRALIRHSYQNVPYYHRLFNKIGITSEDIRTVEDLRKIPILSKDDLRAHHKDLIASNASLYNFGVSSTSGSTGKPVTFYLDQQNREIEYASNWRQREWAGISLNDRIASFRAYRALRGTNYRNGKPLWKFNALSKELEFNIFALNKKSLEKQVKRLREFQPKLIEGYPSAIELLSNYVLDQKIRGISPVAIQTSSESLATRRQTIKQAFNCKVFDWYSQSEYVASACECPEGNYHIAEPGIMEFIKDGEHVGPGELGEIVGTRLYNYSMPLIRYRITDIGRYSKELCNCGRGLTMIQSIEGRVSDSILRSDGKIVPGMAFEHYWKHEISPFTPHIDYIHVIQRSNRKITIKLVKRAGYSEKESTAILGALTSLLGSDIQIEFEELDSIPEKRKWRFSESELNVVLI
jgi:phenylacetate-CoA ligase